VIFTGRYFLLLLK